VRILILDDDNQGLAAIETALRRGGIEIHNAGAAAVANASPGRESLDLPAPAERLYVFAGWTLDATARDVVSPSGRRVDLTSSEFDLLMAFIRRPGQTASRSALLGALRGRAWTYFDRSIDTLVAQLRKKIDADPGRPPLIRSVRGVGYVFCAPVSHERSQGRLTAALS
jgi:DNA-binding response OmpR family regulator